MRDEPRRAAGTGQPSIRAQRGVAVAVTLLPPLLGIALTLALFHPGLLSPDSALQYAQALGLQPLDDVHPPLLVLLWRATDALWPGPGGLFVLLVTLWWSALAWLVAGRVQRPLARALVLFAIAAWPPALLMLAHLWKDVAMAVALLVAVAAIVRWRRHGSRPVLLLALAALVLASGFRHNAAFAAGPLLLWCAWPRTAAWSRQQIATRIAVAALGSAALLMVPSAIVQLTGAARSSPWTAIALWDLAPLSIAAGSSLYPPQLVAPDLAIADLDAAYVPWSNVPLFATNRIRLSFYVPYSAADRRAVASAWWRAVRAHPLAYIAHRNAMAGVLLFGYPPRLPRELVYSPMRQLPANAPVSVRPVDATAPVFRFYERLRGSLLFAGAPYLALALLAPAWARWRRRALLAPTLLAASAWANALPLWLLSGSSEFRYLLWTVLAALLAALFAGTDDHAAEPAVPHPTTAPARFSRAGYD